MDHEGITKSWRRDEWRDHLTLELVKVEVTPEDDLHRHISSPDCDCIPEMKYKEEVPILIHNSFDGREMGEVRERGH